MHQVRVKPNRNKTLGGSYGNQFYKAHPWDLVEYSDSDWAGDKDDRRSVSSYQIYLNDVLIAWHSKSQKTVALLSSEAEFCACSEAAREVPFIAQILMSMKIPINLPVTIWINNVGAIFMTENQTSSARTRHTDTRWWYVSELQEQGLINEIHSYEGEC
jgi:hypothetical protein